MVVLFYCVVRCAVAVSVAVDVLRLLVVFNFRYGYCSSFFMPSCTGSVTLFSCISLLGKYFYSTQLQKSVGKKFFRHKTVGLFIFRSYNFV